MVPGLEQARNGTQNSNPGMVSSPFSVLRSVLAHIISRGFKPKELSRDSFLEIRQFLAFHSAFSESARSYHLKNNEHH